MCLYQLLSYGIIKDIFSTKKVSVCFTMSFDSLDKPSKFHELKEKERLLEKVIDTDKKAENTNNKKQKDLNETDEWLQTAKTFNSSSRSYSYLSEEER
jgi:hypothetical protein